MMRVPKIVIRKKVDKIYATYFIYKDFNKKGGIMMLQKALRTYGNQGIIKICVTKNRERRLCNRTSALQHVSRNDHSVCVAEDRVLMEDCEDFQEEYPDPAAFID